MKRRRTEKVDFWKDLKSVWGCVVSIGGMKVDVVSLMYMSSDPIRDIGVFGSIILL